MKYLWFVLVAGCGNGGGGGHPADAPSEIDSPRDSTSGVHAVAHVVKGPTNPSAMFAPRVVPAAPADGQWALSPHSVQMTLTTISFEGSGTTPSTGMMPLTGCTVTFDAATASMSALTDCMFDLPPGTYASMNIGIDPAYHVTIDDSTNGFYTDANGITTTAPAGGASAATVTAALGNGFQHLFSTPLVVTAASTPSIYVVVDAVQTVYVTVSGGTPAFGQNQMGTPVILPPVFAFPTVDAPGKAEYFAQAMTAGGVDLNPATNSAEVRIYSDAAGQPVYAFIAYTSQAIGPCFTNQYGFGAFATDPSQSQTFNDGSKIGGWLAKDPSGTFCWTLPADKTYSTYAAAISMPDTSTLGAATTFSCAATSSPTPPPSGSYTYAAGCPTLTPTASVSLGLVAD